MEKTDSLKFTSSGTGCGADFGAVCWIVVSTWRAASYLKNVFENFSSKSEEIYSEVSIQVNSYYSLFLKSSKLKYRLN